MQVSISQMIKIKFVKRQRNQKLMPVQYRDMKNFDLNNFNTDLQNLTNDILIENAITNETELNKVFSKFVSITLECINRHAPLKRASRKKKTDEKTMDNKRHSSFDPKKTETIRVTLFERIGHRKTNLQILC